MHEAKRWLSLGLSATPGHHALNAMAKTINTRLNVEELGLPKEVLEIDPSLNFKKLYRIINDLIAKAQYDLVEIYAKRGIVVTRQEFGETHANNGAAPGNLAVLLQDTNRFDEAEPLFHNRAALMPDL